MRNDLCMNCQKATSPMNVPPDFEATGFSILDSRDGRTLRLQFLHDDGRILGVIIPRSRAPMLMAELQTRIVPGSLVPISKRGLQHAEAPSIEGWQVTRKFGGSTRIMLFLQLGEDNRQVSLPIELTLPQLDDLLDDLGAARV